MKKNIKHKNNDSVVVYQRYRKKKQIELAIHE